MSEEDNSQFHDFVKTFFKDSGLWTLAEKAKQFKNRKNKLNFLKCDSSNTMVLRVSEDLYVFIKDVLIEEEIQDNKFNPLDFADTLNDIVFVYGENKFLSKLEDEMRDLDADGIKWVYLECIDRKKRKDVE